MRLNLNPIEPYRTSAIAKIDEWYRINIGLDYKTIAYAHKRQLAESVKNGASIPEFDEAASLEGLSSEEFADQILSKSVLIMSVENGRRDKILRVKSATTIGEIDTVLKELKHG